MTVIPDTEIIHVIIVTQVTIFTLFTCQPSHLTQVILVIQITLATQVIPAPNLFCHLNHLDHPVTLLTQVTLVNLVS